jgi:hypothetical protein
VSEYKASVPAATVEASDHWNVTRVANGFMVSPADLYRGVTSSCSGMFVFHTPEQVGEFIKQVLQAPKNGGQS